MPPLLLPALQVRSLSELHQQAQKYNGQLQEYNGKLQQDLAASNAALATQQVSLHAACMHPHVCSNAHIG